MEHKDYTPKTPHLAADCAIINQNNEILLIKKTHPLFKDCWAIPGGHVDYGEKVEDAAAREAKEEVNLTIKNPKLFGIYSDPKRDPRWHVATAVYVVTDFSGEVKGDYESSEQQWFAFDKLPEKLAADHRIILNDIVKWLKKS